MVADGVVVPRAHLSLHARGGPREPAAEREQGGFQGGAARRSRPRAGSAERPRANGLRSLRKGGSTPRAGCSWSASAHATSTATWRTRGRGARVIRRALTPRGPRRPTRVTAAARAGRLDAKRARSEKKRYAAPSAERIDRPLRDLGLDVPWRAAITPSILDGPARTARSSTALVGPPAPRCASRVVRLELG